MNPKKPKEHAPSGPLGQRHEALEEEVERPVKEEFEHPTFPEGEAAKEEDRRNSGLDDDPIYGEGVPGKGRPEAKDS